MKKKSVQWTGAVGALITGLIIGVAGAWAQDEAIPDRVLQAVPNFRELEPFEQQFYLDLYEIAENPPPSRIENAITRAMRDRQRQRLSAVSQEQWQRVRERVKSYLIPDHRDAQGRPATFGDRNKPKLDKLHQLEKEARKRATKERNEAIRFCKKRGIPWRRKREGTNRKIDEVLRIENGRPVFGGVGTDAIGALHLGTSALYPGGALGLNLTGKGRTIYQWDWGVPRADHAELKSRVTNWNSGYTDHATGVAGIMIASGNLMASGSRGARGMSYESKLVAYHNTGHFIEVLDELGNGMLLSNHSWKNPYRGWELYGRTWRNDGNLAEYGKYDTDALDRDDAVLAVPQYVEVWGASNEREGPKLGWRTWDSIPDMPLAKNVIAVGALRRYSNQRPTYYTAYGPTDDGRIKPDLVAFGEAESMYTTNTTSYGKLLGTSAAAPQVTGSINLLQQLHTQLFPGKDMLLASTLKGLILHTATDINVDLDDQSYKGGPNGPDRDGNHPGPDYGTGWGLLNAKAAANLMKTNAEHRTLLPHIKEILLPESGTIEFDVRSNSAGDPLWVTICWTDPTDTVIINPAKRGLAVTPRPTTNTWYSPNHGLSVHDGIVFSTDGLLPTAGTTPGVLLVLPHTPEGRIDYRRTHYVQRVIDRNTFVLGHVPGRGSYLFSDAGAGTHTFSHTMAKAEPRTLVNDLDVRINQGNSIHEPWVPNPAAPTAPAGRGDNVRDNVEQVFIENPIPGDTYTVKITHKGLMNSEQMVSVLVSGNVVTGAPFQVLRATRGSNGDLIEWRGSPGLVYRVQSSNDLIKWSDASGDLSSMNELNAFLVLPTNPNRNSYYRVIRL